jgi:alpha-amylase/alpha-mannosidase (GH57 family)
LGIQEIFICEKYLPELLDSFKELFKTGAVDLIEETYFHSLSGLYDDLNEFEEQVKMHRQMIRRTFNYKPKVFRNTEAIYDNRIAQKIADLGYKGIITEGAEKILGWRSPNFVLPRINMRIGCPTRLVTSLTFSWITKPLENING